MKSEEDLIRAMARGEEYALEILFERHYESLWKYLLVVLRNPGDSQEVINETFFRAFRYARSFQGEGPFAGWLFKIARNLCMDYLKKRKDRIITVPDYELPSGERIAAKDPSAEKVVEQMAGLKKEYCEVILLKDIAGYSMREIAGIMGKTVPAVKTLHHRAIKKLRGKMNLSRGVTE